MILIDKNRFLVEFEPEAETVIKTIRDVDGVMLNETERWYVNFIVSGLKGIGVWGKIKALYGFVGGTAASHRWNWKHMRDLDEAFRIDWNGTITHSASGVKGDGLTGYGDTNINPSIILERYNTHISFYTNLPSTKLSSADIGAKDNSMNSRAEPEIALTVLPAINASGSVQYNQLGSEILSNVTLKGLYIGNRPNSNLHELFTPKNKLENINVNVGILPNSNIYILNESLDYLPIPAFFSDCVMQFASIGNSLTEFQAVQMSHIITTAQGILGRK